MVTHFEVVDAYTHAGLRKHKPIEALRSAMAAANVGRAVLVQHLGEFDNSYIGDIVAAEPQCFAGACLVDETAPGAEAELERLRGSGQFRGVRFLDVVIREQPELVAAASRLGFIIVLYARDGIHHSERAVRELFEAVPGTRLVVTHLGSPHLDEDAELAAHRAALTGLAELPGVYAQLSGMHMATKYPYRPLHTLIEETADAFGTSRMLWGSNFPPLGGDEEYVRELLLTQRGGLPLPPGSNSEICGATAMRLWFDDDPQVES